MKQFILSVTLSLFVVLAHGQNTVNKISNPGIYLPDGSKFQQYKQTFEIKNISNPSIEELEKIDITNYWSLYKDSTRVEVTDKSTGFILVLYSNAEMRDLFNSHEMLISMPQSEPRKTAKSLQK